MSTAVTDVAIISTQCVRIFSISISIPFASTARRPKRRIRKQTPATCCLFPAILAQVACHVGAGGMIERARTQRRRAARGSGPAIVSGVRLIGAILALGLARDLLALLAGL